MEATIALSIAFVASELAKAEPGKRRLTESYPWVVAFVFGLLHGFGFAGALKEVNYLAFIKLATISPVRPAPRAAQVIAAIPDNRPPREWLAECPLAR